MLDQVNQAALKELTNQLTQDQMNQMGSERAKMLTNILLASAGIGATGIGLSHLLSLNQRQALKKKPNVSEVRVELYGQEKDRRQKANRKRRLVNPNVFSYTDSPSTPKVKLASDFTNLLTSPIKYTSELISEITNPSSPTLYSDVSFLPMAALTGAVGLGGGAYGVNKLVSSLREAARKKELARAEKEFEEALAMASKTASEGNTLLNNVDRIANVMSKYAVGESLVSPEAAATARTMLSAYITAAMALGGVGLYGSFKANKAKSKAKAIERAQLERMQEQSQRQYPAIYAEPGVSVDDYEY